MQSKTFKRNFWLALAVITILSFIDYQFFASRNAKFGLAPLIRGGASILILATITTIGYWVWAGIDVFKKVWLYAYAGTILFVAATGIGYYVLHLLPYKFLTLTGMIRPFFCSPMPMFILYLLFSVFISYKRPDS